MDPPPDPPTLKMNLRRSSAARGSLGSKRNLPERRSGTERWDFGGGINIATVIMTWNVNVVRSTKYFPFTTSSAAHRPSPLPPPLSLTAFVPGLLKKKGFTRFLVACHKLCLNKKQGRKTSKEEARYRMFLLVPSSAPSIDQQQKQAYIIENLNRHIPSNKSLLLHSSCKRMRTVGSTLYVKKVGNKRKSKRKR